MFLLYIPSIILLFIVWRCLRFYRNYKLAQAIGLPMFYSPVYILEPLWLLTKDVWTPWLQRLPLGLGDFTKRAYPGWSFHDSYSTHARVKSDAFTIVSPGKLEVLIADAEVTEDIFARQRKDFHKSPDIYDLLATFGPNVDTVNGETWQRHRRITAPPFNENISEAVWVESLRQAQELLEAWVEADSVNTTTNDTMTLALHVLTSAGFGISSSFRNSKHEKPDPATAHKLTYRNALSEVIENMVLVIALNSLKLTQFPSILLPAKIKRTKLAVREFSQYLSEMVSSERDSIAANEKSRSSIDRPNLLSVLLRSSDDAKKQAGKESRSHLAGLSDDEIYGNLFIYNVAGHDTTANTLAYAIMLLAAYPQWQDWVGKEIDEILRDESDTSKWEYERIFPKLQRCLAVMFETLRIYGPVVAIPRYTADSSQPFTLNGKTHIIPPHTDVYLNLAGTHHHPKYWGDDASIWRPDRWIKILKASSGKAESETFVIPIPGSYSPWAGGPRGCPGKKFAQVEFVAVIASLLHSHRVEIVRLQGTDSTGKMILTETAEQAQKRILGIIKDSSVEFTLKMRQPAKISLRWVRRQN